MWVKVASSPVRHEFEGWRGKEEIRGFFTFLTLHTTSQFVAPVKKKLLRSENPSQQNNRLDALIAKESAVERADDQNLLNLA